MANTTLETLVVKERTKYGFKTAAGEMIGISKYGTEAGVTPETFVPGSTIAAKIYTSASGKKYVTAKPSSNVAAVVAEAPKAEATAKRAYIPKATVKVDETDYTKKADLKDVRIRISGLIQAVIGSPLLTMVPDIATPEVFGKTIEEFTRLALKAADKLVKEQAE